MLERETKSLSSDAKYNLNDEVTREIWSTKDDILSYPEKYKPQSLINWKQTCSRQQKWSVWDI